MVSSERKEFPVLFPVRSSISYSVSVEKRLVCLFFTPKGELRPLMIEARNRIAVRL